MSDQAVESPSKSILESGIAQVQQALASVPQGKKYVWVTTVDQRGVVRSSIAVRASEHWQFGAEGQYSPDKWVGNKVFVFVKVEG